MTQVNFSVFAHAPYTGIPASFDYEVWAVYPPEVGCIVAVPASDVRPSVATLTDDAYRYIARGAAEGLAFKVQEFVVGSAGYNPAQWTQPIPVDSTTVIAAERYRGPITNREEASIDGTVWSYTCAVPQSYNGTIGEIALIAEILHSPVDSGEVGTQFVYAIGHCAGVAKHARKASTFRILIRGG